MSDATPTEPWVELPPETRWAPIPEALLFNPNVSAEAVRVYGILVRHGMTPENCYPSNARLAAFMGKSKDSVRRWVAELERGGWVERVERFTPAGDRTSNGYRIHFAPRAGLRDPRAVERVPPRAEQRVPPAQHSAGKESKGNESKGERETPPTPAAPDAGGQGQLIDPPAAKGRGRAAGKARKASATADSPDTPAPTAPTPAQHEQGRALATRLWERRKAEGQPVPAQPFIAVAKIAAALLAAGHDVDAVGWGMYEAATISTRSVEVAIAERRRRTQGSTPQPASRATVTTNREGPGGVWTPPGRRTESDSR